MTLLLRTFFIFVIISLFQNNAFSQEFGQNKVNYNTFDWKYIQSEHFDIYYTRDGYETALIASSIAEYSYESITKHWNYIPKKRIPILVYNSHNDFSQTNVIMETIEEGTGGFTELFKNRVVIPWEGSLDKFKHVINHELTHAIYFDMLYGGVIESIVGREYLFQLPLWFAEGLAEHESQYWSTEADMIIRDGIITGYLPPIENIYGGYLVYKGGESFFKFLQEKYGSSDKWMAGEMLQSLSTTKNLDKTFKSIFGKGLEDLSKEWQRTVKINHWPEVSGRELPEDFSTKLTDHRELENYLNINPAFNPTGDKIAFLTDRNEYKEIMVMSAIDGTLSKTVVKGEKAGDYEEMHWLRGGITWSPDGTMVAFASKSGEKDAIHIKKVESDGFNKIIKPDMDAIFTPEWSPDGKKILFSGMKNGYIDLFTIDVETETETRLTNDIFDESGAKWSPDGKKIIFSSDKLDPPYDYKIFDMDGNYDIFVMNADGTDIKRIVKDRFNDRDPSFSPDGKHVVFISDRNGINNIYCLNIDDNSVDPLTNLLTGAASPRWSPDGTKIAFASFKEGGWDIYILKRPTMRGLKADNITPTIYRANSLKDSTKCENPRNDIVVKDKGSGSQIALEHIDSRNYKIKFSPDMFNAFASYNTFYGIGGMGQVSLSDVMGNHRVYVAADLLYNLEESNILASYYNLKRQTNYGISAFHYKTYYRSSSWDIFSDRIYGGSLLASRPLNKFKRIDLTLNYLQIARDAYTSSYNYYYPYYSEAQRLAGVKTLNIQAEFVNDTAMWGYTGPTNGSRYKINVEHSPSMPQSDISYTTIEADYRKYFKVARKYNIVTRFGGGASVGEDPRMFFLGGTDNWLNARIKSIPPELESMQDIYFARFPSPLRAYKYYEEYGRRYFITNLEFRFPFIDYLSMHWPLPITIGNINGVVFSDIASAWDKPVYDETTGEIYYDKSFHGGGNASGSFALDDIKMSWGMGIRMNLGFAVLRFDTAWRTNIDTQDPKPFFCFSIGPDF